jgi:flavin reductase (DIM6/NTAB) family NADH-FMN oxidoreductase RutF
MTVDEMSFRQAAGSFASSVTVLAVAAPDGFQAMTATAFCSLSLNPPLVLTCLDKNSRTLAYLSASKDFNINVLGGHQEYLSTYFSTRGHDNSIGEAACELTKSGLPVFEGSVAHFECECVDLVEEGDHIIVVGRVADATIRSDMEPLLYFRGTYRHLA